MAGMFDLHTIVALQAGLGAYLEDRDLFESLFFGIPQERLREWHDRIVTRGIRVGAAYAQSEEDQFPFVAVQLEDEPHQQFLGRRGGANESDGAPLAQVLVKEQAVIYIFATHPEIARVLYHLVRAVMLSSDDYFDALGYHGPTYEGGGDLVPQQELLPENLATFVRTQRWSTISEPRVVLDQPSAASVLVASADVTVGGYQGGVIPDLS